MLINEIVKPNQLKAKSKKPKLIKPNRGHESKNVNRGKFVGGEAIVQGPWEKQPRQGEFDFSNKDQYRYEIWAKIKLPSEKFEDWAFFAGLSDIEAVKDKASRIINPIQQGVPSVQAKNVKILQFDKKEPRSMNWKIAFAKGRMIPVKELGITDTLQEKEGKKDACYHKVKSRYKVWPSAYASGALVQCRKKGAENWGNKSKD